jgi:hypothetical protein
LVRSSGGVGLSRAAFYLPVSEPVWRVCALGMNWDTVLTPADVGKYNFGARGVIILPVSHSTVGAGSSWVRHRTPRGRRDYVTI